MAWRAKHRIAWPLAEVGCFRFSDNFATPVGSMIVTTSAKSASPPPQTLDSAFADATVPAALRERFSPSYTVADGYWASAMAAPHLTSRMKELVVLALHASASALNSEAVARHVRRARDAGATEADILDVLLSIVGLANHALYFDWRTGGRPSRTEAGHC
jgi:alkylhydroperoxidase/carboxymuconolactone decarboxylase family protein YurZ